MCAGGTVFSSGTFYPEAFSQRKIAHMEKPDKKFFCFDQNYDELENNVEMLLKSV